jgi:nucleotide-binding universal stress UspA family protein
MANKAIISYDGTSGDRDALALGAVLAQAGAELVLAYVRHTREEFHAVAPEALLERGACWLDDPEVARRVVLSASTPEGLRWLAEQEDAAMVVFGSDYRTPAGHVSPQHSAQSLLDGGVPAVAIAPAGYAQLEPRIRAVAVLAVPDDGAALQTARGLADRFEAALTFDPARADLLVIGSRPEAQLGTVLLSARSERAIEDALCPVLVVARGVPLPFAQLATIG